MEDEKSTPKGYSHAPRAYALSGKIILSALVVLLAVVFLIFCLHVYVRCFLLRRRRNQLRRDASRLQRHRQSRLVVVGQNSSITELAHFRGLDASTLRSLPLFVFSTKSHPASEEEQMECAVCLNEFQEGEMGKLLPKCNHSFHIDCIDMWFLTHSTCPLCRAAVQSQGPPQQYVSASVAIGSVEPETGVDGSSSSRLCTSCRMDEETCPSNLSSSSSSLSSSFSSASSESIPQDSTSSFRKKALGCAEIRIEVPSRVETLEGESSSGSPGGQGLKSPGSRMLSLKRILSWERRFSPRALTCSSPRENYLERGDGASPLTSTSVARQSIMHDQNDILHLLTP